MGQIAMRALEITTDRWPTDSAYIADLEGEIADTRAAYVEAAVTEIATLRCELFGPQAG